MLLKHLKIAHLVLLISFFNEIYSQVFNTGIKYLTPNTTNSIYTITNITSQKDVILAIASFTSVQKSTVCSIIKRPESSIFFTCTDNIPSVGYLFYQKTPLIYSNVFDYYLLPDDQRTTITWYPPVDQTIIHFPTLRAMLIGFILRDTNYASIQLWSILNNTAIVINRTINVKKISFSFIMIQNYGAYNLSFVQILSSKYKKISSKSQLANVLNFWGIQSLKFQKIIPQDQIFFITADQGSSNNTALFLNFSANLLISNIFLISNQNKNATNCLNYYNPALAQCQQSCNQGNIMKWDTTQFLFKYCYNFLQSKFSVRNYSNFIYTKNNSKDLLFIYSRQNGCSHPFFTQDGDIICLSCIDDFVDYKGACVCKYGFIKAFLSCRKCRGNECQIKQEIKYFVKDVDQAKVNIQITTHLDMNQILQAVYKNYKQKLTINGLVHQVDVVYDSSTATLSIEIRNVLRQNKYNIFFHEVETSNQNSLFYIRKNVQNQTYEYLWSFSHNLTIDSNLSSQIILKNIISTLTANSDKTVPFIFALGFVIGDKINLLSFFQTISIIYLTKFIEMKKQFDVLNDLIGRLFVFHPKAMLDFVNTDKNLKGFTYEKQVNQYNSLIYLQTKGNMLLKIGINQFLSLLLQIVGISVIFFVAKKLLRKSSNMVSPVQGQNEAKYKVEIIKEQKNNQEDTNQQQSQPIVKKNLRARLLSIVESFNRKKYVHFTSLILTYNLYFIILGLNEMHLPLFNFQALLSRMFAFALLFLILAYPIFLINIESVYLLKSISVLKKKYRYTKAQIWLYFYFFYYESTILGILIIFLNNSIAEVSIIFCFQLLKLICFRKMLKNIEILKISSILVFYLSILLDLTLPVSQSNLLIQITVIAILLVVVCQVLKLIRGLIIITLILLKGQQKKEKNKKKREVTFKNQLNQVLTQLQQKYENQQVLKTQTRNLGRKQKQYLNQNKQYLDDKQQSKKEKALKRFKQICRRRRDVLKLRN